MRTTWILLAAIGLSACTNDDDAGDADAGAGNGNGNGNGGAGANPSGFFLTAADLTPGTLYTMSAADLASELDDEGSFFDQRPESDDPTEDDSSCVEDALGALKVEASGDRMTISGSLDLSSCLDGLLGGADASGLDLALTMKMYVEAQCEGADLSMYDGQSIIDIADSARDLDELCDGTFRMRNHLSSRTVLSGSATFSGQTITLDTDTTSAAALQTTDGGPCVRTVSGDETTFEDGCVETTHEVNTRDRSNGMASEKDGKDGISVLRYVGLRGTRAGEHPYFTGGAMEVTLQNWTGTMTYTDAETAPTWSMSDGTETQTGTFDGTASQGLVTPARGLELAVQARAAEVSRRLRRLWR
jgi:hypothetical protein